MKTPMYHIVLLCCGLALVGVGPRGADAEGPPGEPEKHAMQQGWLQAALEMVDHFAAMKRKLAILERLEESKALQRAAFSAGNPTSEIGDVGPHPVDTILIFKKVFTNIPDVYDKERGTFTAPEGGVYFFTFFYHSRSRKSARSGLSLFKNGERVIATSSHHHLGEEIISGHDHTAGGDFGDNGGNSITLELQKGDRVFVVIDEEMSIWGDEHCHNTFSGFQIIKY